MAVTTKKTFPATSNATTTTFTPVSIQLNNQDDLDVYVTLSGGSRVLQLRQSTGSTAQSSHPQVNNTDGLYYPAVSAGTTLYNYQLSSDNNTITFNSALPSGAVVFCERRTRDADSSYTTFASGSTIRATDLNNSARESNFTAQEARNKAFDLEGKIYNTLGQQDLVVKTTDTGTVDSTMIANGTIVNADINASADIAGSKLLDDSVTLDKLGSGALPTDITVASANLVDGTIVNADINSSADIQGSKLLDDSVTLAKLGSGALPTDITVASANLVDGTIVNADVNASAAIAGTKVTPAFGSQNVSTSGTLASGAQTVTGNIAVSGTVDGRDVAADGTKLDGIESGATADQTAAEIRTLTEAATDSNVFTDADHTKLNGIETAATADQTDAEIKTAYENNADTNEFSDAEQSKLAGIETAATADQTAAEIKTLLQSDKLTLSEMNTTSLDTRYFTETELTNGALDGRYYTETEAEAKFLRQDSSETIASGVSWSNSDAFVATTAAINARIIDLIDEVGGFTAIANQTSFPTTNPQGATGQSAILSVASTTATLTPSGTTVTIANGAGSGNTVTITGVPSVIPQNFGFLVESTATLHTYTFHRLVPIATQVNTIASNVTNIAAAGANVSDINNFADIYQISGSAPTQRVDGTSLQEGDLWFDNSNDNLRVWDGTQFAIITPSQSVLDDVAILSGAITYSEDLGLITAATTTGTSNGSLDIVADILEDEVSFTVTVAGGKFVIDGVSAPALTLYKGWTYTFDVSDSSNGSHPLRFKSGGSAYSTGVVVTGTQGSSGATVKLTVPETQPTSFQYYCTNHSNMGNTITVKDDPIKTVADINTEIVAVANDSTDIGAVAAKATEIGRLGTAAAVADLAILGTNAIVADMDTLADISSNITTVANNDSNVTAVANNSSNINSAVSNATNINAAVNNSSNINTVAGISANVTTVAGISSDVTTVANNNSNVTAVAGNNSNITAVANNSSNINAAVSNATNINSAVSNASNINSAVSNATNINTVAGNISDVNNFADQYQIANSNPTTDGSGNALAAGDLYFNTSANELRVYNGSAWQGGVTATGSLSQLSGNVFTGDNRYNNNIKAKFGNNSDLQIFFDTSDSIINASGAGNLKLQDQGNTKLEVTSSGVTLTGTVTAGTIDGTNLQLDFGTLS